MGKQGRFFSVAFLLVLSMKTGQCDLSTAGCGTNKTCFFNPSDCRDLTSPACLFVSWRKADSGDNYDFEMSGSTGGGGQYIAFALGTVNKMQDADLYYCDGDVIHSAVITAVHTEPTYLPTEPGISTVSAGTNSGVAQCVMSRPPSITKNISNDVPENFDITQTTYYLLVASGNTKANGITYHKTSRIISDDRINFSSASMVVRQSHLKLAFYVGLESIVIFLARNCL